MLALPAPCEFQHLASGIMRGKKTDASRGGQAEHPQRHMQSFDFVSGDDLDANDVIDARKLANIGDVSGSGHNPALFTNGLIHPTRPASPRVTTANDCRKCNGANEALDCEWLS